MGMQHFPFYLASIATLQKQQRKAADRRMEKTSEMNTFVCWFKTQRLLIGKRLNEETSCC